MALVPHIQRGTLGHGFSYYQPCSPRRVLPGIRTGVALRRRRRSVALFPRAAFPSRTQRIMEGISTHDEVGGAGGSYSYEALKKLDRLWSNTCATTPPDERDNYDVISRISGPYLCNEVEKNNSKCIFHVIVCGGTLGIFIATALVSRGLHVGIVERNQLKGREQEWNISGKELMELVDFGILTKSDIEQICTSKFNPNRCGFEKKGEIWVEDILNLGVSKMSNMWLIFSFKNGINLALDEEKVAQGAIIDFNLNFEHFKMDYEGHLLKAVNLEEAEGLKAILIFKSKESTVVKEKRKPETD